MIIRNDIDRDELIEELKVLDLSKSWRVDIEPFKANRSNAQNSLLFMWLRIIDDDTGQGVEDLKDDFAIRFLGGREITRDGRLYIIPKSTSKLNVKEFSDYLSDIERFALEMGIPLPHTDGYHEAMGR